MSDILFNDVFRTELSELLNKHGADVYTNTPDFVLADYIAHTLGALQNMMIHRNSLNDNKDAFTVKQVLVTNA